MKGKTGRKSKRFWNILFPTYVAVISFGCIIASYLVKPLVENSAAFLMFQMYVPGWYLLVCFWSIVIVVLYFISGLLSHNRSKISVSELNYFVEINFRKPEGNTVLKVINGLLNAEKVEPFYVHAAPKSKEVETVYSRLKETGFAMIYGGPGEGKSMVTYHAAYKFKEGERYYIYRLKVELLEDKKGTEIIDEILFQLDNLKGKSKLIIVDDAHKLAIKRDINIIMQQEVEEGHCKYIWVETEFYEGKQAEIQPDMYIRVDFKEFFGSLLENFYRSQDPLFQEALKGRIKGLDDAINRVNKEKIRDVWCFAFVASQGEKRLTREIDNLLDPQLLVLFLISAYTVLSGESELSSNYLLNKLYNFKLGWLTEAQKRSSFSDVIRLLQEQTQVRKSMIRVYDKSEKDRGYIASLHYNFARTVIKASLPRVHLINDLVSSTEELLTSEYHKCAYIGVFHRDIGLYAAGFDRKNKDWLVSFINNLLPEKLQCYYWILKGIENVAVDVYDEIIRKLDIDAIAENVNSAEAGQFTQLAHLLDAIGDRRDELIEKLDLERLSRTANSIEIWQFDKLAHLLDAIGDRRNKLIEKLDLKQLSRTANNAEIEQFDQLANLLNAIGDRRNKLIEELDLKQFSRKANNAEIEQFDQLAHLLYAMGDRRNKLIKKLDLVQLGTQANNAKIEQSVQIANLLVALGDNRNKLIEEMDLKMLGKASSDAKVGQFNNLAQLLKELGERRDELIKELNLEKLVKKANQATPCDIIGLTLFISQLEEKDRGKFIQEVDWCSICQKFPIYVHLFNPLGASLGNLWKKAEKLSDKTIVEKVAQHLRSRVNEIKQEVRKTNPKHYSGVAKFLWNCNQIDPALAKQIANETMYELVNKFRTRPTDYQGVGQLINAYHEIGPCFSLFFIENNRVKRRIQQSINTDDWSKEIEGLKYLIKAFYRSAPDLWKIFLNKGRISVDLNSLDLNSIYREVDEEKNVGTAHNAI